MFHFSSEEIEKIREAKKPSVPIIAGTAVLVLSKGVTSATKQMTNGAVNTDANNPAYSGQLGSERVDVLKSVHAN